MYKYTAEYCKNNKVAIFVRTEEDRDGLKKLNCHSCLVPYKCYPEGYYVIPFYNAFTHDKHFLLKNDYELIEASEFIKNNLKTNKMEKKIIGYKLTKPEYEQAAVLICKAKGGVDVKDFKIDFEDQCCFMKDAICEKWLKDAGVLDLWFEPVYKKENQVKPGDYLYFIDATKSRTRLDYENINDFVVKVTDVGNDAYDTDCKWITIDSNIFGGGFRLGGNGWIFGKHVRFATPEEIEKAKTKVVRMGGENGFDLTIYDKKIYHNTEDITGYVQTICALYPKHDVKKIGGYDFHIKDIVLSKTGCENKETYLSEWISLYEMIKS